MAMSDQATSSCDLSEVAVFSTIRRPATHPAGVVRQLGSIPKRPMTHFEVHRCSRQCAISGRELKPGEVIYSTITAEGADFVRRDYSAEVWSEPPAGIVGWWKSQIPSPQTKRAHWAPNDLMLDILEQLETQPERMDVRYVLSLLLVRRRVLRHEESLIDAAGTEINLMFCPRRETTYQVATVMPHAERAEEIQRELSTLLFSGGPG